MEYTLSDLGKSFIDVIDYMKQWGDRNLPDVIQEGTLSEQA